MANGGFNALPLILGGASAFGSFLAREEANDAADEATRILTGAQGEAGDIAANALLRGAQIRQRGAAQAGEARVQGLSQAVGTQRDTLSRALERIDPELLSARGAQNLLNDALGVNGPEAQEEFFSNFQDDPGFQAELQDRINAVDRSAAARGQLLSGRTLQEVGDVGQRFRRGAFTERLNRLATAAQPAVGVAQSGANLISGTGANIANLERAMGEARARSLENASGFEAGGVTGAGNIRAAQGLNIANALARGRLQRGANETEFINNLLQSGAIGSAGFPSNAFMFGGQDQVSLGNVGQTQVGAGGLPVLNRLRF